MQRRYGRCAVKNRCVVALRIEPFHALLFEEPVEAAPARVRAFLQDIARDFLGLPREANAPIPFQGHVHVEQDSLRESLSENKLGQAARELRRLLETESPALMRDGYGNGR